MKDKTRTEYQERILKVLIYIQQNLDHELELYELASIAHFSPYHFHRIFRGIMGETLAEHIRRIRLERSASHLKYTKRSVTDIAFTAGYENVESFTRAFKICFGVSPSNYRKNVWNRDDKFNNVPSIPNQKGGIVVDVKVSKYEPIRVAFIRHIGPYEKCGVAWEKLCSWAGSKNLLGPDTLYLGLCHDDPEVTLPDKIRYDACITVSDDTHVNSDIGVQFIDGGNYAVVVHKGPLTKLADTYVQLCGKWASRAGREIKNAPSVEVYLNNPDITPPEDIMVEIRIPLED